MPAEWPFLTNRARVLLCIAAEPTLRLREIAERVGVTERAAHRIVNELVAAGHLSRTRVGRRNEYTVHHDRPLPDRLSHAQPLGDPPAAAVRRQIDASAGSSPGL